MCICKGSFKGWDSLGDVPARSFTHTQHAKAVRVHCMCDVIHFVYKTCLDCPDTMSNMFCRMKPAIKPPPQAPNPTHEGEACCRTQLIFVCYHDVMVRAAAIN